MKMIRIDVPRFAAVYAALNAAHDVADHILQTDVQAAHKADFAETQFGEWGRSAWMFPMAGHLAGQALTQGAALALIRTLGVDLPLGRTLVALGAQIAAHGFLDRRWPVTALLRAIGSPRFAQTPAVGFGELEVRVETPRQADARHAGTRAAAQGNPPEHLVGKTVGYHGLVVPLHGPYLADQAAHHGITFLVALAIAVTR